MENETYKVLDADEWNVSVIERKLNELSAQGFRVVATVGPRIILARLEPPRATFTDADVRVLTQEGR